jgi:hypothetical protein
MTSRSSGCVIAETAPGTANGQYNQGPLAAYAAAGELSAVPVDGLDSIESLWVIFDFDAELNPLF